MDLIALAERARGSLPRPTVGMVAVGTASLLAASSVAALLETWLRVADASPVYLLAVVVMAGRYGTWEAVATSVASVLVYDFFFTEPRFTFQVADPQEWLNLLLFLVVAVVIGRLAALQTERAEESSQRAREAQSLFAISRSLATATSVREAADEIVERLCIDTGMVRVWIGIGPTVPLERPLADSTSDAPRPEVALPCVLRRQPGDRPAEWVRIHTGRRDGTPASPRSGEADVFRVAIDAEGQQLGSVWAVRRRSAGRPGRGATRILSLAADQLGLAIRREQLSREATEAEIARQSDALKSALLDSVSHDLRTPLASIRASAGSLMDAAVHWPPEEARSLARSIDAEAERLSDIVRNLLDLSRIQAGALVPELEVFELRELVEPVVRRLASLLGERPVTVEVADDLPPVLVDPVLLDAVMSNLLENAARYSVRTAPVRITARTGGFGYVEMVVEDGGPGVPAMALDRVFDKFFRVGRPGEGARRGLGIGLTIVRGFVEAMGGHARAGRSELGGLAVHLTLPIAPAPPSGEALT